MKKLVLDLLKQKSLTPDIIAGFKRQWAKKTGLFPKNSLILEEYKKLLGLGKVKAKKSFEKALRLKKVRSLSGIVPVAVMTKPYPCPGKCVYCPTQKDMPKSYLKDEPAVMRAQMANFDPYLQVKRRLNQLKITGHSTEKIELIVMGGTYSSLPKNYQVDFIAKCFLATNKFSIFPPAEAQHVRAGNFQFSKRKFQIKDLEKQQKENETAKNRIIGITLETRPDEINKDEVKWMRKLGATRVEIGVQSVFDDVLKKVKRGHKVKQTINATLLLKDAGFKICYHLMPNLPGSNLKKDYQTFKEVFENENFKPDMLKIYPCVILYQAQLYNWFKKDKFKPYTDENLMNLLIKIKKIVPEWVRINRLGRDIPVGNIAAGNKMSNIRQILQRELKKRNIQCKCIRCREVKDMKIKNCKLKIVNYSASGGVEYFLQYVDENNNLYALLRLRTPKLKKHFLPVLQDCALIRELHTYGKSLPINKTAQHPVLGGLGDIQHQGLGKELIKKAEEITKSLGIKKIAVISGVGAREYYRRLGYKLQKTYMIKSL